MNSPLPGRRLASAFRNPHLNLPAPARQAMPPQQFRQRQFRGLVAARADARHHFRPLRLGEHVRHGIFLTADPR